jgi:hypothetical protein
MSGTVHYFRSTDVSRSRRRTITGFSANRPNLVSVQNPNSGPKITGAWLNPAAFAQVIPDPNSPVQQFGNAGRNIGVGPGFSDWDFSIFKNFRVTESKNIQFRAEFFNILNHPNFRLPDSDISSPTFNTLQAALPPRVVQLALTFLF